MTSGFASHYGLVPARAGEPSPPEEIPRAVVAFARNLAPGEGADWHSHRRAQLLYARSGTMTVSTDAGTWVVPPERAVWIPSGIEHRVQNRRPVEMRTLYVEPDAAPDLPDHCCVISVSPLLRELIMEAMKLPSLYDEQAAEGRLVGVILDRLAAEPVAPLHLPVPDDPRLAPVIAVFMDNPGADLSLSELAALSGMSERTFARAFNEATGTNLRSWREKVRLLAALERLADGVPVTQVALDLGYDSPSAFIAMFRRNLGTTPGRYFSGRRDA